MHWNPRVSLDREMVIGDTATTVRVPFTAHKLKEGA